MNQANDIGESTEGRRVIRPKILYVGTPVFLVASENPDGSANLAPASSYWALGQMLVLGIETDGQTIENLRRRPELTVNFPSGSHWEAVERLAALTARHPVPRRRPTGIATSPRSSRPRACTPRHPTSWHRRACGSARCSSRPRCAG